MILPLSGRNLLLRFEHEGSSFYTVFVTFSQLNENQIHKFNKYN